MPQNKPYPPYLKMALDFVFDAGIEAATLPRYKDKKERDDFREKIVRRVSIDIADFIMNGSKMG